MCEWIVLMSEFGELCEEVLLCNVELFGCWQFCYCFVCVSWVCCWDDVGCDLVVECWCDLIEQFDIFFCECLYYLVLQDLVVIDFIVYIVSKEFV